MFRSGVVPVVDNRKQAIPRKFALVVDHAEDVGIEETGDGKSVRRYCQRRIAADREGAERAKALPFRSKDVSGAFEKQAFPSATCASTAICFKRKNCIEREP